ncbi:hypothetical protein ACM25N_04665 [Roseovarius sp. C7]|uniref:hypothetical protein n=1 Tax=Roseovarius sp. C7 TaxID=3398643 RepID=UPI0039F58284
MDIHLHLGAHRAASTSFQYYMRSNADALGVRGFGYWGPPRLRKGLFHGVTPVASMLSPAEQMHRARGRIGLRLAKLEARGLGALVVSDENMLGSIRHNLRHRQLYPAAGQRLSRYRYAMGGRIDRVMLCIRAPQHYWASAYAFTLMRVGRVPGRTELAQIAAMTRSWRDVIADIACALPETEIIVLPHERLAPYPEARLAALLGQVDVPRRHAREVRNARPSTEALVTRLRDCGVDPGPYAERADGAGLFHRDERARMAETYTDDLYWLRAGAEGLARICEETTPEAAGINPDPGATRRGQMNGTQARRMA